LLILKAYECSRWLGLYNSDKEVGVTRTRDKKAEYSIRVKAKDVYDYETAWSDSFIVTMPRNRAINTPFLNFLENHPLLFQLLQRFLNL